MIVTHRYFKRRQRASSGRKYPAPAAVLNGFLLCLSTGAIAGEASAPAHAPRLRPVGEASAPRQSLLHCSTSCILAVVT
ncbi:MAG: hypothetical protein Q7T96_00050 [Methylobacter sp.]|nr:hypothetical protein [Methylobacter sp.]